MTRWPRWPVRAANARAANARAANARAANARAANARAANTEAIDVQAVDVRSAEKRAIKVPCIGTYPPVHVGPLPPCCLCLHAASASVLPLPPCCLCLDIGSISHRMTSLPSAPASNPFLRQSTGVLGISVFGFVSALGLSGDIPRPVLVLRAVLPLRAFPVLPGPPLKVSSLRASLLKVPLRSASFLKAPYPDLEAPRPAHSQRPSSRLGPKDPGQAPVVVSNPPFPGSDQCQLVSAACPRVTPSPSGSFSQPGGPTCRAFQVPATHPAAAAVKTARYARCITRASRWRPGPSAGCPHPGLPQGPAFRASLLGSGFARKESSPPQQHLIGQPLIGLHLTDPHWRRLPRRKASGASS